MKPRGVLGAVAVATGVVLLAGCNSDSSSVNPPPAGSAAPAIFAGYLEPLHTGSVSPADLGADDQAFGLRLLHDVCAGDAGRNTVLSPASGAQALGML